MSYICPKCNHTINISEEKLRALGYLTVCPECFSTLKIIGNYAYIPTENVPLTDDAKERDKDERESTPREEFHPLYHQAVEFLATCNAISTPMLQSRFNISSEQAAELMRDLERHGIVGPYRNGAPRKILIPHNQNLPSLHWLHPLQEGAPDPQTLSDGEEDPNSDEVPNKTYGCTINLSGCFTILLLILAVYFLIHMLSS